MNSIAPQVLKNILTHQQVKNYNLDALKKNSEATSATLRNHVCLRGWSNIQVPDLYVPIRFLFFLKSR